MKFQKDPFPKAVQYPMVAMGLNHPNVFFYKMAFSEMFLGRPKVTLTLTLA